MAADRGVAARVANPDSEYSTPLGSDDDQKKKRTKKSRGKDPFNLKPSKGEMAKKHRTNVLYFQADEDFHASNQGQRKKLELFALKVRLFTPGGREIEAEELRNKVVLLNYNTGLRTRSFNPSKLDLDVWSYEKQGPACLLYTSPSPRDGLLSRMPSSA